MINSIQLNSKIPIFTMKKENLTYIFSSPNDYNSCATWYLLIMAISFSPSKAGFISLPRPFDPVKLHVVSSLSLNTSSIRWFTKWEGLFPRNLIRSFLEMDLSPNCIACNKVSTKNEPMTLIILCMKISYLATYPEQVEIEI